MMNKLKTFLNRFLNFFNKVTFFIDALVLIKVLQYLNDNATEENSFKLLFWGVLALLVLLSWRFIKAMYLVIKSRGDRAMYLVANRVVAISGKQRAGKTSLALYFSKGTQKVYTNVPMRLKRKYTNKLTTDILTLKTKIDDGSCLVVDEANLFYNNKLSDDEKMLFGQALLCQCVGHFFDGNIFYIATDVDRIPKIIRDEWSVKLQVLRSNSIKYSYIGDILLKLLYRIVNRQELRYTGVRQWEAQQYETIEADQYIALVGQTEKENRFAPVYSFADFTGIGLAEYDDRYMNAYYQKRPDNIDIKWDSLQLSEEDFKNLYDGMLKRYIEVLEKDDKPPAKNIKIRSE